MSGGPGQQQQPAGRVSRATSLCASARAPPQFSSVLSPPLLCSSLPAAVRVVRGSRQQIGSCCIPPGARQRTRLACILVTRRQMRVAVTGGTGFIGGYVVAALHEAGHSVRCLLRPTSNTSRIEGVPYERVLGDVTNAASIKVPGRRRLHFIFCASSQRLCRRRASVITVTEYCEIQRRR